MSNRQNNSDPANQLLTQGDMPVQEGEIPTDPPGEKPFITRKQRYTPSQFGENKGVLIATGAVILVALLFIFTTSHKSPLPGRKRPASAGPHTADSNQSSENSGKSLAPITEPNASSEQQVSPGAIKEQDVERTATTVPGKTANPALKPSPGASLGSLPPFDNAQSAWQAPSYQSSTSEVTSESPKPDKEPDPPSLVFVHKLAPPNSGAIPNRGESDLAPPLGLPTGTRLRARLEVAANTAVQTPAIAVIEYNYEKNGEIIVPAGSRALGHLELADRSGYVAIRFDSLLLPDGNAVPIEAVATDPNLQPLKGRVEGKNTGKNAVVRSLSGIGQVGALVAGRGTTLNQPFSEGDLVRERVSTNIGQIGDQEITRLAVTEHVVVSLPANTPIYIVLDHGTRLGVNRKQTTTTSAPSTQNLDSLRQLLQLQQELNQQTDGAVHP